MYLNKHIVLISYLFQVAGFFLGALSAYRAFGHGGIFWPLVLGAAAWYVGLRLRRST
jgi:hypothetical protein